MPEIVSSADMPQESLYPTPEWVQKLIDDAKYSKDNVAFVGKILVSK